MSRAVLVAGAMALCLPGGRVAAHEITYTGTVASVAEASIVVDVVDPGTEAVVTMTFDVDAETEILRGDVPVTFEEAAIVEGEAITVVIDHDLDETLAMVVRLAPSD